MTWYLCPVAEACLTCYRIEGVELTSASVEAWRCTRCSTSWAVSVVNPHLRDRAGDYAEEVGRLRCYVQQIVALGDAADGLTDRELRDRLPPLAGTCATR